MEEPYREQAPRALEVRSFLTEHGSKTIQVCAGDVYEWVMNVETRAGPTLPTGERIYVLEQTRDTPFNEVGPRGHNWLCRTSYGVTVWATLEQCLDRGLLRKIDDRAPADVVRG